ncbi:hypothetical protein [Corynebacterium minutissimum]|uniref:Phage protein n=1 Tax=Corynebacterium minutissimum TaxID=38301 RepID=A0A376CWL2_9CORY|nr:hypothetical protein [Corynebacterium minutissimum]QRP60591.1 hypothetical protein I6J26_10595 [Corynebacterium minutissimum]STC76444.1 Uncharacterised protein [Corynebacterium minutissimum]
MAKAKYFRPSFHWNDGAFEKLLAQPEVVEQAQAAAEKTSQIVRAAWPSDKKELTPDTPGFKHGSQSEVFNVEVGAGRNGRQRAVLLINHPYAVAFEARLGAITNAIHAAGFQMNQPGA